MKKIQLALIGAGERGQNSYAPYARLHGFEMEFVAVAELIESRRNTFARSYEVPAQHCYETAEEFLLQPKMADAVMICTQDNQHFEYACDAIKKGYSILLEKPISPSALECLQLQKLAEQHGTTIMVCHVLRYTPFFSKLKEILDSKTIGDIVSVTHTENVAYWHYAHSYVRGNWHKTSEASPMILAKCCHDMDILAWLVGSRCKSMSSHGGLFYFNEANAPANAPKRCLDGCEHSGSCPYYAPEVYLNSDSDQKWPTALNVLGRDLCYDEQVQALKTGPYGMCVFRNDNDVVDHQVANFEFENGATVAFTMCAFSNETDRTIKIMCTKGEIRASMTGNEIEVTIFGQGIKTGASATYKIQASGLGHGGGDDGIMAEFIAVLKGQKENTNTISQSVHSHIMSFAAEESRLSGKTIGIAEFEAEQSKV